MGFTDARAVAVIKCVTGQSSQMDFSFIEGLKTFCDAAPERATSVRRLRAHDQEMVEAADEGHITGDVVPMQPFGGADNDGKVQAAVEMTNDLSDKPFGTHPVASTSDVDEAHAALESVYHPRRLRLDKPAPPEPALDLVLNALPLGEVTVSYVQFGCRIRATFEAENIHVNVPLSGVVDCWSGETERVRATPERGAVFMPDVPGEVDWHSGCAQLSVVFPRHAVQLELEAMLGRSVGAPINFALAMDVKTDSGQAWMAALWLVEQQARCSGGLLDHALTTGNLQKLLIDELLVAQPHNYTEALTRPPPLVAPRAVRQVIELLQSHPEQPWTISSLAGQAAVSARCLQEGFRRSTGVPPMRYLRDVRLHRVHDDLRAAAPDSVTVGQIARRWGFRYLGRFAADYREKFGQTPSETLRAP